jgi:uncharacterized protein
VFAGLRSVLAQSDATLAGMEAYNHGDSATAHRLLSQEATAGDAEARVNLGYLFARGQGVWANQRAASRLYGLPLETRRGTDWCIVDP